jgi:hypothetical protein
MEEFVEALQRLQSAISDLTAAMPMHAHQRGGATDTGALHGRTATASEAHGSAGVVL